MMSAIVVSELPALGFNSIAYMCIVKHFLALLL